MQFISHSPQQTHNFALKLAKKLHGGEIIALTGDLGGGKTCFCQGLARALGIQQKVLSPSFVLMKTYPVPRHQLTQLCHVDLYRIRPDRNLLLTLREYWQDPKSVMVIEWANKIKKSLPLRRTLVVHFQFLNTQQRRITLRPLRRPVRHR